MKKYVSELIGEEYKKWKEGDTVIITTPTGSGKTSFVLSKLLQQAVEENMHILYLCNRKVLSEQFREQSKQKLINECGYAENVTNEMLEHIHVFTYQYYEAKQTFPCIDYQDSVKNQIIIPNHRIKYFIFDEAHYFLGDALFNKKTNYWFEQNLTRGISVFLTATPQLLELFLASKCEGFGFRFEEHAENIYRLTKEKRHTYRELIRGETLLMVDIKKGLVDIEVKRTPQSQIREVCSSINPYASSFRYIELAHARLEKRGYVICPDIDVSSDYSQYDVWYFNKEEEITQMIREKCENSNEKWLVFIDSMEKGLVMAAELNSVGCDAIFLSEQRIRRDPRCKSTYREIVNGQHFTRQVLITTPVLDCGINIVDEAVKNVILFQHDYTTFIQSLGRKRLSQGEKVNLFVQVHHCRTIEYHCRMIEKKLDYISMFCLKDTADVTGSPSHHVISTSEIEMLKNHFREGWAEGLVCQSQLRANAYFQSDIRYYRADREKYSKTFFPEWQFSRTAFLRLVWNLQDYYKALDDYHNTGDDCFFLKHQLRWIGKEYNRDRLLGYPQKVRDITELLKNNSISNTLLRKDEQTMLSEKLLGLLMELPLVLTSMKKDISRYRKGEMLPKKKKLNDIFEELNLPYRIQSTRKKNDDTGTVETCWVIENCNT